MYHRGSEEDDREGNVNGMPEGEESFVRCEGSYAPYRTEIAPDLKFQEAAIRSTASPLSRR